MPNYTVAFLGRQLMSIIESFVALKNVMKCEVTH